MDHLANVFFEYLRSLLYEPENALDNLDQLGEQNKDLASGMQYFAACLKEMRQISSALAKGNLTVPDIRPENELAAPLKRLHAALKHVTWQTQQVAKGDYQQQVDFMGDFSEAFNVMVKQLDQRQKALEREMEQRRLRFLELEQSNSLLEALTDNIPQWLIVLDKETSAVLFTNDSAESALQSNKELTATMREWMKSANSITEDADRENSLEFTLTVDDVTQYYQVVSYPLRWKTRNAVAHMFLDVSAEKQQVKKLQTYAYQDNLTRINNRFYGMQILQEWLDAKRHFCISFADLDNLKSVNDNYGHREGDRYIIRAADQLVEFGDSSVVSRLGGDEFMIMVPTLSKEECDARMQEIREKLIQQSRDANKPYRASISYGTVEVNPDNSLSGSELLAIADERMYIYKRAHKAVRRTGSEESAVFWDPEIQ